MAAFETTDGKSIVPVVLQAGERIGMVRDSVLGR